MQDRIIHVTGEGSVHIVPDVMRLLVEISGTFKDYNSAYAVAQSNSSWMKKILEYNHLDPSIAKTIGINIEDHMKSVYDNKGYYVDKEKDGYDLDQKIRIDLGMNNILANKIVKGIGKFIKGAQVRIGFTVKDIQPVQLKMLERAVKDAKGKAQVMAEALGCNLGEVNEIRYGVKNFQIFAQTRCYHNNSEAIASTAESLDVTPEDLSVRDQVDVSWILV